jgi:hypothetical protein
VRELAGEIGKLLIHCGHRLVTAVCRSLFDQHTRHVLIIRTEFRRRGRLRPIF